MTLALRCTKLPALPRRLIALVGVPLIAGLMAAVVLVQIFGVRDGQAQWREDARRLLSQAKEAPSRLMALDQEIATMRSSALWSKFYSAEASGAGSSATSLHADVGALLATVQAAAQSLTPIPAEEAQPFNKIGVRCATSMRVNQLQSLMVALNAHPRYLRVERLLIVAPQVQQKDENPPLAVTMDIFGYELSNLARPAQHASASPQSRAAM